ncbi:MAG: CAP domain-containing protein [Bacteroidota bacterium]
MPLVHCLRLPTLCLLGVLLIGGCIQVQPAEEASFDEAADEVPTPPPSLSVIAIEAAVFDAVNDARAERGFDRLAPDDALDGLARSHSERMATVGFFDHRDDAGQLAHQRAQAAGYAYRRFGENLFRGALWDTRTLQRTSLGEESVTYRWHTPESLAAEVVQGWLTSPSHRENMLSADYRNQGIGVAADDDQDIYVTQTLSLPRSGS